MSQHNGDSREHHQMGAELHDGAAHAHLVASVAHEKQDHPTGHENSTHAMEHSLAARNHTRQVHPDFGHEDIAAVAHGLWEARGRPDGSSEQDWFHATRTLRAEHVGLPAAAGKGGKKNVDQ